jgi:hypothetical protein
VIWILLFCAALALFFAGIAVAAAAGSSRDAQAEEQRGRSRRGADMCHYHVRLDEDGNEVLVTDPHEGRPAA